MSTPRKLQCQVTQLIDHGEGVYTVRLKPENRIPKFKPGQFLHLALDEYDPSGFWPESRVFSIASSPNQGDLLEITYSVVGKFTTRMEQELEIGNFVWVKLPYGDFIINNSRDIILYAGGTGMTAFTAYIKTLRTDNPHRVCLFYGARNKDLLIYRSLIEKKFKESKIYYAYYYVEENISDSIDHFYVGNLSIDSTWPKINKPYESTFYLSGPPAMIQNIIEGLKVKGISNQSIKIDAWS